MSRKRKKRKSVKPDRRSWWGSLTAEGRARVVRRGASIIVVLALITAGSMSLDRLEAHVTAAVEASADPVLVFPDLPDRLRPLAFDDLHKTLAGLTTGDWTSPTICQRMANRLADVGWVEEVASVRRNSQARFEIHCHYRHPFAMVQHDGAFYLVDRSGVRLPGTYLYDPTWQLVQGMDAGAPPAGARWQGNELQAALTLLEALQREPYKDQITAVLVENFNGRVDPHRSHVELATDRAGGRIRWGSAPGLEVAENPVAQKLAILRENYHRTGRADAHHAVIDVSTFPDRFTIPG